MVVMDGCRGGRWWLSWYVAGDIILCLMIRVLA